MTLGAITVFAALRASPFLAELPLLPSGAGRWLDAHGTARHLVGYGLLAFAACSAAWWRRPRARLWPVLATLLMAAVALEAAQIFLPDRHADWRDVAMSWAGVALGGASAWFWTGKQTTEVCDAG